MWFFNQNIVSFTVNKGLFFISGNKCKKTESPRSLGKYTMFRHTRFRNKQSFNILQLKVSLTPHHNCHKYFMISSYQTLIISSSTKYIRHKSDQFFPNLIYPTQHWFILPQLDISDPTLIHPSSTWYIRPNLDPFFYNSIYPTQHWSIHPQLDIHLTQPWSILP